MSETLNIPKDLLDRIAKVTNKRARFVLDSIAKNGLVTTEQINHAGYDHPPRAAQDVRDLGFCLKTIKVKHTNGRSIAAYVFGEGEFDRGKAGRRLLPKRNGTPSFMLLATNAIFAALHIICRWTTESRTKWRARPAPMRTILFRFSAVHAIGKSRGTASTAKIASK